MDPKELIQCPLCGDEGYDRFGLLQHIRADGECQAVDEVIQAEGERVLARLRRNSTEPASEEGL